MKLLLLDTAEARLRYRRVASIMKREGIDCMLLGSNTNIYYLTGRVFAGYVLINSDAEVTCYVRRPVEMDGDNIVYIRKPEQITPGDVRSYALELDSATYSAVRRLRAIFPENAPMADASSVMMEARSVKTPVEIEEIRYSAARHDRVYRMIPGLYTPGMTDIEFQVEIERVMRLEGCLGYMRVNGESMEINMGNLLAGENADTPSPYDFTMGGEGTDPSMPVGANGSVIHPGETVMADMNGNFNGYMTDMTRTFTLGDIPDNVIKAHQCSIDICRELAAMGKPGVTMQQLYGRAMEMVKEAGLTRHYMGYRQQAPFIGHGIGIQLNEMPVITARSVTPLAEGNVIAIEPKFVFPHVGAAGIENTYLVTPGGMVSFNHAPEQLISLTV